MSWLNKVYQHHDLWISKVEKLGGGAYSEDIVMEAYIKIDKYNCEHKIINNDKVSEGYMYFVLRSLFIDYKNAKKNIRKIQIEDFYKDKGFTEIKDKDLQKFTDADNMMQENGFGKLCNKIDREIDSWHWYDRKIFELYRDTPLSIRGMAKEIKISKINIFHTLKKGKARIKKRFTEDYEDYKNEDYDLI